MPVAEGLDLTMTFIHLVAVTDAGYLAARGLEVGLLLKRINVKTTP